MDSKIIFENKLTSLEINENRYWMNFFLENFSDYKLSFKGPKYSEIVIPEKIFKLFPSFAKVTLGVRLELLNGYFIFSDVNDMDWGNFQLELKSKGFNSALLWFDQHSLLRRNIIDGLITNLNLIKNTNFISQLSKMDLICEDENLKKRMHDVLINIKMPNIDKELIERDLNARVELVENLLKIYFNLFRDLENISK
jgi:hypothetical protein